MRISVCACALTLLAAGLTGCGNADIAPVTGHVMFDGKPVTAAQVTFSPVPKDAKDAEPGKPGTGFTDESGAFVLSTYKELDGAQVGEHDVTVALDDLNPAKCKRVTQLKLQVKPGHNELDITLQK